MNADPLDQQLARIRSGEDAVYRQFFAKAVDRLRAELRHQVPGENELDVIVHECLIAIHDKLHTISPGRPVTPWLRAIGKYKLVDHWRKRDHNLRADLLVGAETAGASDALIDQLVRNGPRHLRDNRLAFAMPLAAAALVGAFALLVLLGPPFASVEKHGWGPLLLNWLFSFTLTGGAIAALYSLAYPARRSSVLLFAALAPLAVAAGLTIIEFTGGLGGFPGGTWQRCLLAIGLLGTLGLASSIHALRRLAPVRLRRAGIAAGLFGGGLAACVYAPFCPESSIIHSLVFHAGPIAGIAAIGWLIGPRLLRW